MTFNKYTWDLYKQTKGGRRTIEQFEKAAQDVAMYELISKYNPMEARFTDKNNLEEYCELLWELAIDPAPALLDIRDARNLYEHIIDGAILFDDGEPFIEKADYKTYLIANMDLSFMLFFKEPEYFFPNMFRYHFFDFKKSSMSLV